MNDIVEIVRETVSLTARADGRSFSGLCPFHDDHDPSLFVFADKQVFRCWACNAAGDAVDWVMRTELVDRDAAVRIIAGRRNAQEQAAQ